MGNERPIYTKNLRGSPQVLRRILTHKFVQWNYIGETPKKLLRTILRVHIGPREVSIPISQTRIS